MSESSNHKPQRLNLDANPKYLAPDEAYYLLNNNLAVNPNSNTGNSQSVSTPTPANYPACEMELMPLGENYAPNTYESKLTNEVYSWVYNSNGAHYIQRVNSNGECEVVLQHECLELSIDPKHQITQFRAYMKVDRECSNRHGKQLIWTDGLNAIGQVDVEASIATHNFTTPFFQICPDPCAYIQHCVPQPCKVITAEYVPLAPADRILSNKLNNRAFQFIYRHIYYDRRASEWSVPSTLYFQDTDGCFDGDEGLPRCMKLRIPIGNPMVEKIEIGFRENMIVDGADVSSPLWSLYETVEKYNPYTSPTQYWYERTLAPIITSTLGDDCAFDFFFCNDKQCQIIPVEETNRVFNPMPRKPQGILEIKDSLGFYNYEQGNCPISKNEIDKFTITPDCDAVTCLTDLVDVTVRAVITTGFGQFNDNQFVWRDGGNYGDGVDDENDQAYFGGMLYKGDYTFMKKGWGQEFSGKKRNFTVYIEGTDYAAEMEQWISDRTFQNRYKYGVVSGIQEENTVTTLRGFLRTTGSWFYQEYKFKVPRGTKGYIKIANQDISSGYQNTSVAKNRLGLYENIAAYRTGTNRLIDIQEIYFDTCNGDVELENGFAIHATPVEPLGGGFNVPWYDLRQYTGYVSDSDNRRIEFAEIWASVTQEETFPPVMTGEPTTSFRKVATTDWNGFFSFTLDGIDAVTIEVRVEQDCTSGWQVLKTMNLVASGEASLSRTNIQLINDDYADGFYEKVRVPVRDCDGNLISGVRIAMTEGKYQVSNEDGYAEFIVRNKSARNRRVKFLVMDARGCFSKDCDGECNYCLPTSDEVQLPQCFPSVPNILEVPLNGRINTSFSNDNISGLKTGGRYPFGFIVKGNCGRQSAVYELPPIEVPKIQQIGHLQYCDYRYNGNGITLPDWADCLLIVRGENTNDYQLQWVVDKVERTVDRKIKLTIQSLSDYNSSYFFKTNTIYQWLKGDRIEFIRNGDNDIFDSATHGILNYLTLSPFHDQEVSGDTDAPAEFYNQLLIEDDGKLDSLTEGAIIEIQRAAECTTEPVYFSIGVSIPIVDGKLVQETGTFHTFDTFIVRRVIDGRQPQEFEHHSPSDFWGDHISDVGQAHFPNKYENERRYGRNITLNSPTQFNYYGSLVKRFDAPGQGDITAMDIKDGRIILAVCEHDNFLAEAADDLVRVGSDGTIRALPPDAIISDGQPKISGQYGCQYPHVGSVLFGDGWATFADVNKHAYIIHDYQIAKVAGEKVDRSGKMVSQCSSYFKKRFQELETANRSETDLLNHLRFSTGFNKASNKVYLTIKKLRDSGIMNEQAPYLKSNETLAYDPIADDFLTFVSFTGEGYSNLNLFNGDGCAFISMLNGIPYIHPIMTDKWNEFYGVACDWMAGIVINKFTEKEKTAIASEIQDQSMWYVKDVRTDKATFISEVPPIKFKKFGNKWNGAFLGNANSVAGLHKSNDYPKGFFIKVLYVRDNTDNLRYNTFDNIKRTKYSELDNILVKFTLVEQSGFTNNL